MKTLRKAIPADQDFVRRIILPVIKTLEMENCNTINTLFGLSVFQSGQLK